MRTILDVLREFATLAEAKASGSGELSPESEKRWAELKEFYDRLTGQNGISLSAVGRRFGTADIREGVPRRRCLRVPVTMEIVFEHEGEHLSGRILNLSCGGVFLASDSVLGVDSRLILHLANIGRGLDAIMTVGGEVAWTRIKREPSRPKGMGIRFVDVTDAVQHRLDSLVVETLEKHLCGLNPDLLDPEFLARENIKL
jgi:uncharacterized protein (TIGR02266 family)